MFKIVKTLKQYTPLIHFQSDQQGAFIRGTELKPKLDRFLVEYAFKWNFKEFEEYLIGDKSIYKTCDGDKDDRDKKWPAFDYKVRIIVEGDIKPIDLENDLQQNLFFGNMGDDREQEFIGVFTEGEIQLDIFCLHQGLRKTIEKWIASFFAVTNFGHRQNKGFGSFYIKGEEKGFLRELEEAKNHFFYIEKNDGDYTYNPKSKFIESLDDIDVIYALMKGGINFPNKNEKKETYYKSFLFKYMNDIKQIGNEKRFTKIKLLNYEDRGTEDSDNFPEKYVRALLGLTDGVKFKKGKVNYEHESKKIKRFKSPITFKVVGKYIAIIPETIPADMFEKTFIFKYKGQKQKIATPSKDEFDLIEFLSAFAFYFNNELQVKEDEDYFNKFDRKLEKAKTKTIQEVNRNAGE